MRKPTAPAPAIIMYIYLIPSYLQALCLNSLDILCETVRRIPRGLLCLRSTLSPGRMVGNSFSLSFSSIPECLFFTHPFRTYILCAFSYYHISLITTREFYSPVSRLSTRDSIILALGKKSGSKYLPNSIAVCSELSAGFPPYYSGGWGGC